MEKRECTARFAANMNIQQLPKLRFPSQVGDLSFNFIKLEEYDTRHHFIMKINQFCSTNYSYDDIKITYTVDNESSWG